MTENDLPFLKELCLRRYGNQYAPVETEAWFKNIVLKAPLLFNAVRTEHAFCISMLSILPWLPNDIECNVIFICSDDGYGWEAVRLLRYSMTWAKERKCSRWYLASETEYDIGPIAKRAGTKEITPRYKVTF